MSGPKSAPDAYRYAEVGFERPARLARSASGLRHLRWAREVLGTMTAHYEHDARLDDEARAFLLEHVVELRAVVESLSAHVKPYRDFLERSRTPMRGMLRVGRFLRAQSTTAEAAAEAAHVADGFEEAFKNFERRERAPLKEALRSAVDALQAHLERLDDALEERLGPRFVASLYPELDETHQRVIDDGDEDDDATA